MPSLHELTERDLTRRTDPEAGVVFDTVELPDGRELQISKIRVNKPSVRSGTLFVRAVQAWAWHIGDFATKQVRVGEGFMTRREAFRSAIAWAEQNPAGVLRPETQ